VLSGAASAPGGVAEVDPDGAPLEGAASAAGGVVGALAAGAVADALAPGPVGAVEAVDASSPQLPFSLSDGLAFRYASSFE